MLIDTRRGPDPEPGHEQIEIQWRLAFWVASCLVLLIAAASVPALPRVILALGGLYATFKVLAVATHGQEGGLPNRPG